MHGRPPDRQPLSKYRMHTEALRSLFKTRRPRQLAMQIARASSICLKCEPPFKVLPLAIYMTPRTGGASR
jgi:hypothetical protein